MADYIPIEFDDTNQFPIPASFREGEKENIPFGVTIPQVADATAITGLDALSVQIVFDATTSGLAVSPLNATTFTVTIP